MNNNNNPLTETNINVNFRNMSYYLSSGNKTKDAADWTNYLAEKADEENCPDAANQLRESAQAKMERANRDLADASTQAKIIIWKALREMGLEVEDVHKVMATYVTREQM